MADSEQTTQSAQEQDTASRHSVPPPSPAVGGFTAVNGILNKASAPDDTAVPTIETSSQPPPPPSSTNGNGKSNGNHDQQLRSESNRSSPAVNSIYRRRRSSSDSIHSPPIRKRTYPEAFGDREDSTTPKREGYSDDRRSQDDDDDEDDERHYYNGSHDGDEQKLAAEALRRQGEHSRRESHVSNGDDRSSYADYERTPAGALIDSDRKKRKRVFSNRTKTGCMTCRKRKKKCDEMHPECNNCLRGGFVCEGYSTRNTWQKPNATKAPIPLQSKEGPSPFRHTLAQPPSIGSPAAPTQAPSLPQPPPPAAAPAPHSGPPTILPPNPIRYPDEFKPRPELKPMEEARRISPPQHHDSRQTWSNSLPPYNGPPSQQPPLQHPPPQQQQQQHQHQQNPPPPPPPPPSQPTGHYSERPIESRPPLPKPEGLHERERQEQYPPHPAPPLPLQMGPRPSHYPPPPQHQLQGPPPSQHHGPSPTSIQHSPHAQHHQHPQHSQHLQHSQHSQHPQQSQSQPSLLPQSSVLVETGSARPGSHHRHESEREKMLRGEYFLPYTPALMADREQCALAVWRFNNSTNPTMGIKLEDRMNFFRDIVNLRPTHDPLSPTPLQNPDDPPIVGSIGSGVIVEAPFSCDYGYNITIGNDVVIGADCRITDTCSVHIGNNVVFSPGVRLMCATYAIDPKERKKGKGRALGRQIVIEDDVWIGSNVIILPGVKIGRCTTIGAGSLLHKDVPQGVVVAGNPPKVVRGIYDDGRVS